MKKWRMWRIASKKTNGGRDFCLEIRTFGFLKLDHDLWPRQLQHSCQHEPSNCFIARLEAGLNARLDTARHGQNMRFGVMDGTMTWEIIYYVFLCDCVVISSTWILLTVSLNLMSMLSPAVWGSRHLVSTLDIFKSLEFIQKSLMVQKHSWCQDFWTWTCSYETLSKIHW